MAPFDSEEWGSLFEALRPTNFYSMPVQPGKEWSTFRPIAKTAGLGLCDEEPESCTADTTPDTPG